MKRASDEVLEGLRQFDTATVFNAVVESRGGSQGGTELARRGGQPESYSGPELRCLLPELGTAVGYAVTCEMTPIDPDSESIPWSEYYDVLERTPGPIVAVFKDVDARPGRGAVFGEGMAAIHKMLGVEGAVVEGSVRDLAGIKSVGLPLWGTGLVPGHGVFNLLRVNGSVSIAGLRINPSELLVADVEGVAKIPAGEDPTVVLRKAHEIREREGEFMALFDDPDIDLKRVREWQERNS